MNNVSNEIKTHRTAIAQAVISVSLPQTIEAKNNNKVPTGNVFDTSRVAALFAIKKPVM